MYSDIKNESTRRLIEIREIIRYIKNNEPKRITTTPRTGSITSLKGLFFVHIYGVYEFVISSCISKTIGIINSLNINVVDCKPVFLSIALNNNLDSLFSAGNSTKWQKRWDLFENLLNTTIVNMSDEIVPTDGQNYRHRQLESIWKTFCIQDPILPHGSIGGRIQEMVNLRNSVAHGNESPIEIGKRFTADDLKIRFDAIDQYCNYVILTFENYINNRHYLK